MSENIVRINIKNFDPKSTFECGQCFRWNEEADGSYTGVAFGKIANISYGQTEGDEGFLIIKNATEEDCRQTWREYLDLDRDYEHIMQTLSAKDETVAKAINYGKGIRILKQDKWETIISFIISQNNNIPRIKKCIEALCENFGDYVGEYRGKKYYAMPEPCKLAMLSEEDLACCRLGYRARYIIETAKAVEADGGVAMRATSNMNKKEAYDYLMSLCGVGPKVANCILLFSMDKTESFPIDVWVRRVMNILYGIEESDTKTMTAFAEDMFGEYSGFAQQYLFYYIREAKIF